MKQSATIVRRSAAGPNRRTHTLTLPPDLLQKVGSRVKLVAILLMIGFVVDPAIQLVVWVTSQMTGGAGPRVEILPLATNLVAISISLVVWAIARSPRVSQTRLLDVGLTFEVLICLVVSFDTHEYFLTQAGELPHLTWVIAIIILFPLVIPSPPRSMLLAAIAAALTSPLSLLILQVLGRWSLTKDDYLQASINPALAVVLAYFASRVVYGLNVDVVRARQLGSYSLTEKLGAGGMGEVWKAEHRMLARPAAIKLVRSDIAGESGLVYLERFEREVQATTQLQSPHTIAVYDYGVTEGGSFYYVMELLDGLDLEHLLRSDGPLPVERTVHILRQACHSLNEAHRKGMVHRDIKPANIFLCRYAGDVDFVKVLDFGLVKRGPSLEENEVMLTNVGTFTGTPAYASPEMAGGDTDRVDACSDIYSLGCVGFWLLTGRTVFEASNTLDMLFKHRTEVPVAPSEYSEFDVPAELDAVILACLEKDRTKRIPSAAELSARLQAIEQSFPWDADDARRWWDEHRPIKSEPFSGTPGPAEGDVDQDLIVRKSF